jgi:hypothetical protein
MTHLPKGHAAPTSTRLRHALAGSNSLLSVAFAAALGASACTPVNSEPVDDPGPSGSGGSKSTGGSSGANTGGSAQGGSGSSSGGKSGSGGSGSGGQSGGEGGSGGGAASGGSSGTGGAGDTGGTSGGATGGSSGGSSGDAGGPDAPASTGGSGCTGVTGAKFCSDFEMGTAGSAPTGDFTSSGAITIDGAKGFSGTKSLHYKPGGKSQIKFTKQFPMMEQHGRLMMFIAATPSSGSHWDIVQSNGPSNIWSWGGQFGKFELVVDPPDDGQDSSTAIPSAKWVCMQWHFGQGTGGKSEYHVKMDGAEVNKSPQIGHWKAGAWKDLAVGFEVFGSAAIEFWIDDLAFGETEIPCPAAK